MAESKWWWCWRCFNAIKALQSDRPATHVNCPNCQYTMVLRENLKKDLLDREMKSSG